MPWLHIQWICTCTLMLDTKTDAPPCPLWHTSEYFWSNCAKGVFHSSVQIFVVVVVATCSHSSLDNTLQRIVWCGKVRTTWWPWQWCRRCRWATANPAAWKMFVQNIAHRKSEGCGCPIVLQPHVIQKSFVSQLRYEPRLQYCRIRCRIHRSIEKVRSNQIILCLTRPYYDHQALLDRVTACVSHTENTTKFCGSGESRMHYLGHCDKTTILYCTACCAVQCKLNWVWGACCLGVRWLLAHSVCKHLITLNIKV